MVQLSVDEARVRILAHHFPLPFQTGAEGIRQVLQALRCIQLDPLDPMGTNQDLVVAARVDGIFRGQVYEALFPTHAFEHFAKERCILPAYAYPYYRDRMSQTGWWRLADRAERVPTEVLDRVLAELGMRGPSAPEDLADHGRVKPIDWSGWKGTSKATTMALEMLWTLGKVVVAGRTARSKLYDLPERALPWHWNQPSGDFERWAVLERVAAAGLLSRNAGAHWSMLGEVRKSRLIQELLEEGVLLEAEVSGLPRRYLVEPRFLEYPAPNLDTRMRILGPLDPMLWDRDLVAQLFGFNYVWEVYKPANQRLWGWYVHPLLYQGQLVGRLEGRFKDGRLSITKVWRERPFPVEALDECLARHAAFCQAKDWERPPAKSWLKALG